MNLRICAAIILFLLVGAPVLAAKERPPAETGLFQGTAQEQAACNLDAARFCGDAIPDTFKVLDCLKDHREKLKKVCRQVLETHGQ